MVTGFVFPGQGAQSPGMLQALRGYGIEVSSVFEAVSEGCGFDVEDFIERSTGEALSRTEYTQIVMFSVDVAYYKIIKEMGIAPAWVAGHSLGQYAALVASGALDLYETSALLKERSRLMNEVKRQGKLCAVSSVKMDTDAIRDLCEKIRAREGGCLGAALYNSKNQMVVGGTPEAVGAFSSHLEAMESYKVKILPVGQAFHTAIMDEMMEQFKEHIDSLTVKKPDVPVILNCTGGLLDMDDFERELRCEMLRQCNQPVQWVKTMETMVELGTKAIIELGPGRTLCGFMKNAARSVKAYHAEDRKSIEKLAKAV